MNITDLTNLWVVKNISENFSILVVALDEEEAKEIAIEYFNDADIYFSTSDRIEVKEFTNINEKFDCDYVITGGQ